MTKTPTVYDVAADAGVSIATVSRVFGKPNEVRAETRERVMASVAALGYVPSASARGLAARKTGVLGLFLPGFDAVEELSNVSYDPHSPVKVVRDIPGSGPGRHSTLYFDEVLRGGELEAWRRGFALMVGVGRDNDVENLVRDIAGRVDGIAIIAGSVPEPLIENIARRIPVVIIAGTGSTSSYDTVNTNNAEGMRTLTEHVIDQGARHIRYVAGPAASPDNAERFQGFLSAVSDRGIPFSESDVLHGNFSRARARTIGEELSRTGSLPDAVICGNDQMALGVLDAFLGAGIAVPESVIVTGFDGIEETRESLPRLTTVHQPMVTLGRIAVGALLDRLDSPDRPFVSLRLPVEVLLRESSVREN